VFLHIFPFSSTFHRDLFHLCIISRRNKKRKLLFDFNFSLYCYFPFFSVNREPWPNQSRRRKRSLLVNQLRITSHELVIGDLYFIYLLFSPFKSCRSIDL
ncbi:unnamed protein product, partial [Brassica napus]